MSVCPIKNFENFIKALEEDESVNFTAEGEWYVEGCLMRLVRWIFGLHDSRLCHISSVVAKHLDKIEKWEISLSDLGSESTLHSDILKVAKVANKALKKCSSHKSEISRNLLKRRIIAIKYRLELKKPTDDPDSDTLRKIMDVAEVWKRKQEIFGIAPQLHHLDQDKIKHIFRYHSFAKLLLKDIKLQNEVFGWTIRTCNPVDAFVQYPERCKRIKKCLLNGRIGRFAYADVLSIEKAGGMKTLTLPFEGEKISILDETKEVTFTKGGYKASIKDIFEDMKRKNDSQGDFEFIGVGGFQNWDCANWSYKDAEGKAIQIDLDQDKWWKDRNLPVFEEITAEEVKAIYDVEPKHGEWVVMAMATCQSSKMLIDDCHGYVQVLIPDGNGKFRIHIFGKYAEEWPKGFLGKLLFLANTNKAKFFYTDPSFSYSGFRLQAAYSRSVNEEKGEQGMRLIKDYAQRSRTGDLVFMFAWENCAYFPQEILEKLLGKQSEDNPEGVPNLFRTRLLDASAAKPLNYCFNFTNMFPSRMQYAVVRAFEGVLGSWRGAEVSENGEKTVKSASTSEFRTGCSIVDEEGNKTTAYHYINLPSNLYQQISKKKIEGVRWAGHQYTQRTQHTQRNQQPTDDLVDVV